jgi:hypothetical protein
MDDQPMLRNLVMVRVGEKEVLEWLVELATQSMLFLEMPMDRFKRYMAGSALRTYLDHPNEPIATGDGPLYYLVNFVMPLRWPDRPTSKQPRQQPTPSSRAPPAAEYALARSPYLPFQELKALQPVPHE